MHFTLFFLLLATIAVVLAGGVPEIDALLKESGFTGSCLDYTPCNVTSTCADPTQKCIVKNTCADPTRKCYTVGKLPSGYCICDTCPEKLTPEEKDKYPFCCPSNFTKKQKKLDTRCAYELDAEE